MFIICVLLTFAACEPLDKAINFFASDGTGHIFKTALASDPENLDPQLASDPSAVAISKNLYAGLMEYDENGRLKEKLADDYTVSQDGLSYTFYLKEGFKWHALGNYEYPVTADDFVFGFRRLMDPKTASPHSEKYFCIKNAQKAREGKLSPEEIGVNADDDYTITFTLEYPNAEFLYLLAELPAMPCCEDFFITAGGKYGLEAETVCSNGPFFVRYWLHDPYGKNNYVRLRCNPGYSDIIPVAAGGVNYLITADAKTRESDFESGATDVIVYHAGALANTDKSFISGESGTAGLVFNEKDSIFASEEVRQVFSWGIDRDALFENSPETLKIAKGIIPDNGSMYLRGYASRLGEEISMTNLPMAEYKWSFLLSEKEKSALIGMTVMVPTDFEYSDYLSSLSESWYSVFASHISIEMVAPDDYASRLESGDYDIALVILTSSQDGAAGYLKPFGKECAFGQSFPEAEALEENSGRYETLAALNYACSEAENAVLSGYHFLPLWHLPAVCAFDDDCQGLKFDPLSETVYFENAKSF